MVSAGRGGGRSEASGSIARITAVATTPASGRTPSRVAAIPVVAASVMAWGLLCGTPVAASDPTSIVRGALDLACAVRSRADLQSLGNRLIGGRPSVPPRIRTLTWGRRWIYQLPDGDLTLDLLTPRGQLPQIRVQYDGAQGSRPEVVAIVDHRCTLRSARRLHYGPDGVAEWLEDLDEALQPNGHREPLNPPVPAHADPGGLPVALIDTGVNYLLPEIYRRLARDTGGVLLGYDFWDLDERPFDVHPLRSVFFPDHHGTTIASIVLAEAPVVRLLPYRYPRPDMSRIAAVVEHAAAHGTRIVNLSMASYDREDWTAFEQAAAGQPEILFVVAAGNNDRDIDRRPVYPAALPLDNLVVVTAARSDGRLAAGVNWGPQAVDLMVGTEGIRALGFDGTQARVSGSSYATARVSALAACLLAAHPDWSVAELRMRIFARARAPAAAGYVAEGFIADPTASSRGACHNGAPLSGI
jgi:subtilisin family serine protease